MNALKHARLKHSLPLIAALALNSAHAFSATAEHQPSVLATADQRAVETRAIKVFASPRVKAEIAKSRERFLALPFAADAEAKATVDKAVNELAFAATLDAVNGDPAHPRVVWAFTPPRKWLGHEVPGSRWGIDNPDNVYRFAPVDSESRYEVKVRPTASQQAPVQYSFLIYDSFVGEDGRENNLDSPVAALRDQDIKANADGSFTVTIDSAPAGDRPNHLQANANARVLLIRNTFSDWNAQGPQAVSIKRVAGPAASEPNDATVEQKAVRLIQAGTNTLLSWQKKGFASSVRPNAVSPPFTRGGGWGFASTGSYRLGLAALGIQSVLCAAILWLSKPVSAMTKRMPRSRGPFAAQSRDEPDPYSLPARIASGVPRRAYSTDAS